MARQDNGSAIELVKINDVIELLTRPDGLANRSSADTRAMLTMAGQHLRSRAVDVNAALANARDLDSEARKVAARGARDIFETLCELQASVEQELFNPLLTEDIGFSKAEARFLLEGLTSATACSNTLAQALARDDLGPERIARLRETPEWRRAITGSASRRMETESYFAPLLECITREAAPSMKAELTAKMELYIESGWAARDCLLVSSEQLTPAARSLKELRDALNGGQPYQGNSFATINARFEELFLNVAVKRAAGLNGEETTVAELIDRAPAASGRGVVAAPSGQIDAVIRDARDASVLHAAVVTTDISTQIENDQLYRHKEALEAGIRSGALPGAREARVSFYVPSMLYESAQEQRREIGAQFIDAMKDSLTDEERARLNLLPFLSVIGRVDRNHPHFDIAALADFDLRMIGASASRWNEKVAGVCQIEDPTEKREALLRLVAAEVGGAIDVFSKKELDGSKLRSANSNKTLLGAFCSTLEGLTHHGAAAPATLATVQRKVQELRVFKSQISSDSGTKRRLETEILKFSGPAGFAGWADQALESEREDAAIASEQAARARLDQAGSSDMLRRFVADRAQTPEALPAFVSLREDLRRDSKALFGFSDRQATDLGKLLEASAYSLAERAANHELREAAARGELHAVKAALDKGADPLCLDPKGRSMSELAAGAGHPETARWLGARIEKKMIETELSEARRLTAEMSASLSNQR